MDPIIADFKLIDAVAARSLRCARIRGVMRHYWINDGVDDIAGPVAPIRWSASIEIANSFRTNLGLAPLNPDLDPAPDLIELAPPARDSNDNNTAVPPSSFLEVRVRASAHVAST